MVIDLIIGICIIIIGIIAAFFGNSLFKLFLPILGLLVGGIAGYQIGVLTGSELGIFVFTITLAVLAALLATFIWKLGIVLQFFLISILLTNILLAGSELSQIVTLIIALAVATVVSYIVVITQAWEYLLAIAMAFNGAALAITGVITLVYGTDFAFRHDNLWQNLLELPTGITISLVIAYFVIIVFGMANQLRHNPDLPNR